MIIHAEDAAVIERAPAPQGGRYADFLASRPRCAENAAIARIIEAARRTGAAVHLLHLSSSDAIPMLRTARREGIAITAETCPHYLVFEAEAIADGATLFKCCPPIREAGNREQLWNALRNADIDCVVSDHSPCTAELKRLDLGDFGTAWGGISSLQVGLSAVWTEARWRGHSLVDVVRWMAERPAQIARLRRKGRIERGFHADFAVFAPDDTFVVDSARLHHRNPVTPYAQRPLAGVVRGTWLRGRQVTGDEPHGQLIRRGEA
jgi:allantoinase